jgi:riboflavin kinase/FMN adenylyltransferase
MKKVITLGNFDGLHIGHCSLINEMIGYSKARGLPAAVVSFKPHPQTFLYGTVIRPVFSETERKMLLDGLGVDELMELPFDETMANRTPKQFIGYLAAQIGVCDIFVGEDYRFGKSREGDITALADICADMGIGTAVIKTVMTSEKVNSTAIRKMITDCGFDSAAKLLGRKYFALGKVVTGKKLGRTIGIPTINMKIVNENKLLPPDGVYETECILEGSKYICVSNIMTDGGVSVFETHIINFCGDLYDTIQKVDFIRWLRPNMKINSIEELKKTINKDIMQVTQKGVLYAD